MDKTEELADLRNAYDRAILAREAARERNKIAQGALQLIEGDVERVRNALNTANAECASAQRAYETAIINTEN